jgi:branched-chain amino acid transport system substrate-binding protein
MEGIMKRLRADGGLTGSRKPIVGVVVAGLLSLSLAACASGGSGSSANSVGLPSTVKLLDVVPLTGAGAVYGPSIKDGVQLAIDDVNSSRFLGGTKLEADYVDDTTATSTAAQIAAEDTGKYPIIFGSVGSAAAAAQAPIFNRAGQPTIFMEAGGDGVLIGPSLFRLTPLSAGLVPMELKYLQSKKVKTLSNIYDSDLPTDQAISAALAKEAPTYGIKVVGTVSATSTTTDISGSFSKLLAYKTDAISVVLVGAQFGTAVNQINQAKYPGVVVSQAGAALPLASIGSPANGWTWPGTWTAPGDNELSAKFTAEYEKKYGATPFYTAAEAYDMVYYAARALKKANSTDKGAIATALKAVGEEGFPGLLGDVKVKDGQEVPLGLMIAVKNGKIVPLGQ